MERKMRTLAVHDGPFHADEVTATALLLFCDLVDQEKIIRSRDPHLLAECDFVCDVGGIYDPNKRRFDHHQADYKGELSSAGMILLYLKEQGKIDQSLYTFFNQSLILGVDAHDNGRSPQIIGLSTFSHLIAGYNPVGHEITEEAQNRAFFQAVGLALTHLRHLKGRFDYELACREVVKEAMDKNQLFLEFDRQIPWFESFFALGGDKHRALFIIMPTKEGYKLRGIPPNYIDRMHVRLPLPEAWAGLLEGELKKASQIEGAIFCHKGRFTSVWKSKKDALEALRIVLRMNGVDGENFI